MVPEVEQHKDDCVVDNVGLDTHVNLNYRTWKPLPTTVLPEALTKPLVPTTVT